MTEKDEIIRRQQIQIENMTQALLYARKKMFVRSFEVSIGYEQLCLFEETTELAKALLKETRLFPATLPEDCFVFTPTQTSWLNIIESFFRKLKKQMLKGVRVNSKEELSERIYRYFDEINADPVVYHLTHKMEEIALDEETTI